MGYLRYDSADELDLLNDIWELDAGFTNMLSAQQKLVSKHRDGPKVIKRYDQATTPHRRLATFATVTESVIAGLDCRLAETHPGHLSRQIDSLTRKLAALALTKAPTSIKPRVNRAFVNPPKRRKPDEATNHPSRRY